MNTRRTTARRVGEEIANARAISQGNRVPPQVQAVANEQVQVLLQMFQAITTQAQAITAQVNIEVVP